MMNQLSSNSTNRIKKQLLISDLPNKKYLYSGGIQQFLKIFTNDIQKLVQNEQIFVKQAKQTYQQILRYGPEAYLLKNPPIAAGVTFLMNEMETFYEKIEDKIPKNMFLAFSQNVESFVFQHKQKQTVYLGVNPKLSKNWRYLVQNPGFFLARLAAAFQTIQRISIYQMYNFMIKASGSSGKIITPISLAFLMVDVFHKNEANIAPDDYSVLQKPKLIQLTTLQLDGDGFAWVMDFSGIYMSSPFPQNEKIGLSLQQLVKGALSTAKKASQQIPTFKKLESIIDANKKVIVEYVKKIQLDQKKQQQQIKGNIYDKMVEEDKAKLGQQQIDKLIKDDLKATQIEKSQYEIQTKLTNIVSPPLSMSKEVIDAKTQLETAIKFIKDHMKAFKKTFTASFKRSILDQIPYDIALQIVLNERKRRMNRTFVINQLNKSLLILKKLNVTPMNVIQVNEIIIDQQKSVYEKIREYINSPQKQIKILIEKGKRIMQTAKRLQTIQEQGEQHKNKIIETINQQTRLLYGQGSQISKEISQSMNESTKMLGQLHKNISQNKLSYSIFSEKLDSVLTNSFKSLAEQTSFSFSSMLDEMKQQITLLQGRLNINLQQIIRSLEKNSQYLKEALNRLTQISKQISEIKVQLSLIKMGTQQSVQNTRDILQTLQKWFYTLSSVGMQEFIYKDETYLQKMKEITNQLQKVKPLQTAKQIQDQLNEIPQTRQFKNSIEGLLSSIKSNFSQNVTASLDNLAGKYQKEIDDYTPAISMSTLIGNIQQKINQYQPPLNLSGFDAIYQQKVDRFTPKLDFTKINQFLEGKVDQSTQKIQQLKKLNSDFQKFGDLKEIKDKLPQILNSLFFVFRSLGNPGQNQTVFSKIDKLSKEIELMKTSFGQKFQKLNLLNSQQFYTTGGNGGGDDRDRDDREILSTKLFSIQQELARKEQMIQQLSEGMKLLYGLASDLFHRQTIFLSEMFIDLTRKGYIPQKDLAELTERQLLNRYERLVKNFYIRIQPIQNLLPKVKLKKAEQIYDWWDFGSKKIKL